MRLLLLLWRTSVCISYHFLGHKTGTVLSLSNNLGKWKDVKISSCGEGTLSASDWEKNLKIWLRKEPLHSFIHHEQRQGLVWDRAHFSQDGGNEAAPGAGVCAGPIYVSLSSSGVKTGALYRSGCLSLFFYIVWTLALCWLKPPLIISKVYARHVHTQLLQYFSPKSCTTTVVAAGMVTISDFWYGFSYQR